MHSLLFISILIMLPILTFRVRPSYAFALYQIVYLMSPSDRWWGQSLPTVSYAFYTSIFVLLVSLLHWTKSENRVLGSPHFLLLIVILILYVISGAFSIWPSFHYEVVTYFFKSIIVAIFAYKLVNSLEDLKIILGGYVFGAVYLGFYITQIGRNSGDRVEGVGTVDSPDANDVAALLVPSLIFAVFFLFNANTWFKRAIALLGCAFIANALVLINSRGAFLASLISFAFLGIEVFRHRSIFKKTWKKLLGVGAIGIIGLSLVVDSASIERFLSIKKEANIENSTQKESGSTRVYFWLGAIEMAKDYPLGAGALGFNVNYKLYVSEEIDVGGTGMKTVHSTYFEALTEIGYLGLLTLIFLFYKMLKTTNSIKKESIRNKDQVLFKLALFIQASCLSWFTVIIFINRLRAEPFLWLVLITASLLSIQKLSTNSLSKGEKKC